VNEDSRQPLYVAPEERVTLEQLKARAERISALAVSETKRVTHDVYEENATKALLVAVGVVVVVASFAYFLGSRAGGRNATSSQQPPAGY